MTAPRRPKPISASWLENSALHYLQRFASSSGNLRHVMLRKLALRLRDHTEEDVESLRAKGEEMIEALIARFQKAGYLDDGLYAETKARSLHRQGGSSRAIRGKLMARGLEADQIDEAMESLREEIGEELDLTAAIRYARRRRLGPFRAPDKRQDARQKDLAALARAGFSHDVARQVIEAENAEELD